jgi:hypothetical protein
MNSGYDFGVDGGWLARRVHALQQAGEAQTPRGLLSGAAIQAWVQVWAGDEHCGSSCGRWGFMVGVGKQAGW